MNRLPNHRHGDSRGLSINHLQRLQPPISASPRRILRTPNLSWRLPVGGVRASRRQAIDFLQHKPMASFVRLTAAVTQNPSCTIGVPGYGSERRLNVSLLIDLLRGDHAAEPEARFSTSVPTMERLRPYTKYMVSPAITQQKNASHVSRGRLTVRYVHARTPTPATIGA